MNNYMKTVISGLQQWVSTQFNKNKADWNQNDSNALDYIKNRTHWSEGFVENVLLEETSIEIINDSFDGSYYATLPQSLILEEGKLYTVTFDGTEYECIAWYNNDWETIVIGNGSIVNSNGGNNEPFVCNSYSDGSCDINSIESGTYVVKITTIEENIHHLDEKFIPDSIKKNIQDIGNLASDAMITANDSYNYSVDLKNTIITPLTERVKYLEDIINNEDILIASPAYFTTDGNGTITGLTDEGKAVRELVIPSEIDGVATIIGSDAFERCTRLTSVTISDGVTSIGNWAFYGCRNLTSITIPDSVTSIGNQAFLDCTGLTTVTIGNGVTSIGTSVFKGCTRLSSIDIPDSVTSIGDDTFNGCTNLTSVTIPNSVTRIGGSAFSNTSWLASKQAENPLVVVNGILIDGTAVSGDVTIPDSVTAISRSAFNNNARLTSIIIPDTISIIEVGTFSGCTALTSVTISDSVIKLYDSAFKGCTNLTSITIPDSVTYIGMYTFSDCTSLSSIVIPKSITNIPFHSFYNCNSLTIYYTGNEEEWKAITKNPNSGLSGTVVYNYVPEE